MLKEINRKIDILNKEEETFEQKLDNVCKCVSGLICQVNKIIMFSLNF